MEATRIVQQQVIEQPSPDTLAGVDPTMIRYGWVPYKKIRLLGPDGSPNPCVQQYEIAGPDGKKIRNPFWEYLPKGTLIPFPTFPIHEQVPSQDVRMGDGRAALETVVRTQTALACVVMVMRTWAIQGFTILQSLQGLDQRTAQRIFTVVQPFDYKLAHIQSELAFSDERIVQTGPIKCSYEGEEYTIECLHDAEERAIALRLREEMMGGADTAVNLGNQELNDTEMSMINRHNAGMGKSGPDPHDEYLCGELDRGLPKVIGEKKADLSALEAKLDFVVGREKQREAQEEIAALKAEIEALKAQQPPAAEPIYCAAIKSDNTPCRNNVKVQGELCSSHRVKEVHVSA